MKWDYHLDENDTFVKRSKKYNDKQIKFGRAICRAIQRRTDQILINALMGVKNDQHPSW